MHIEMHTHNASLRYFRTSYNYEEHIGLANNARNLLIYDLHYILI